MIFIPSSIGLIVIIQNQGFIETIAPIVKTIVPILNLEFIL
jgi:hypothetical protein